MSKEGVAGEVEIQDDNGSVFLFKKEDEIGRGAQGAVYLGSVASLGFEAKINIGDEVAIKHQYAQPEEDYRYNATRREIKCLKRKGDLLGIKESAADDPFRNTYIVMPYYTGKNLREVMYELEGNYGKITGKKPLTNEQRAEIAYGLLRAASDVQQAGIVYADYKPDHIIVDLEKGTVSIIDFGQAFLLLEEKGTPHDGFQGSGFMYMPPETGTFEGIQTTENDFQTDGYVIGLMIAALYSDTCYELAAGGIKHTKDNNASWLAREKLLDVLGEEVEYKEGMPEDLFKIVRHLTKADPIDRPECIAFADGIGSSPVLSDLRAAQEELRGLLTLAAEQKSRRASEEQAISEMVGELEDLKLLAKKKEEDKGKGKKKAKTPKGSFFSLKKFKSAPSAAHEVHETHELISAAIKSLATTSVDTACNVLEQLHADIIRRAVENKIPQDQANEYIEEISNIRRKFSSSSSSSSSSMKP